MVMRLIRLVLLLILAWGMFNPAWAGIPQAQWYERDEQGEPVVYLHFFWSKQCPHCLISLPYLEFLQAEQPWLRVKSYQLVGNRENVQRYKLMARALGEEARSVPGFMFCNTLLTGFDADTTPDILLAQLKACRAHLQKHLDLSAYEAGSGSPPADRLDLDLPLVGRLASDINSLPFITLAIAGIDAFNPCAFFVLMFLLSMMLHSGSRERMLLVGGVFVFFSGLMYFLFMSAWLNLFQVIGQLDGITLGAALVAILIGLVNVKDFFWFKRGVSLTISDRARPGLYQRARKLLQKGSAGSLLLSAMGLAAFANLYEFLCTTGFPLVYTRILTLNDLSTAEYYLYLALYNVIYVIPLLIIVILFALSLGGHKLQQDEGRNLKLISGAMMLMLGCVLLFDPNLLHHLFVTLALMALAVLLSMLLILRDRKAKQAKTR